jgi:hypothetical protein
MYTFPLSQKPLLNFIKCVVSVSFSCHEQIRIYMYKWDINRNQSDHPEGETPGRWRMTGGMAPQLLSLRLGESECAPTRRSRAF